MNEIKKNGNGNLSVVITIVGLILNLIAMGTIIYRIGNFSGQMELSLHGQSKQLNLIEKKVEELQKESQQRFVQLDVLKEKVQHCDSEINRLRNKMKQ